jgi:methylenetetrahydrofolate dehydrogenase (NADP+)/methenyltetrahydrofolate cyclohydrolase
MSYILIDGQAVSAKVREEIASAVAARKAAGKTVPGITVVLVGNDPASEVYVRNKEKMASAIGFDSKVIRLGEDTTQAELLALIEQLNKDETVHGILVQMPLPKHLDEMTVIMGIDPAKDVDCFHPMNVGLLNIGMPNFISCTPYGVMRLLQEYGINPAGKNAVVVGRSNIVGKPMAALLTQANATVTVCHSKTKDLPAVCREADILVAAIGRAKMITADYVKEGAVVIDVGMNRADGKLCGDVDFDAVKEKASAITPVPKGVGPMTIAMLMANTLHACEAKD